MTRNILTLGIAGILAIGAFSSCKKSKTALAPESYQLTGRIDASRTTIATAALTTAKFTISYNTPNSFGDAQSVLNGNFALTGYTGITAAGGVADTLSFFASQGTGVAISYLTVTTATFSSTTTTNLYSYFNGPAATFTYINFPFTNDITAALKTGNGYFRLGKFPKYVYILMDNVVKL